MKFSEKLLKNWECGLYTLIRTCLDTYIVFSTKYSNTVIRHSGFWSDKNMALEYIGSYTKSLLTIDTSAERDNWKIIKTIHPSELMGKGFEKGQKVRFRKDIDKIFRVHGRNYNDRHMEMVERGYGYFNRYLLGEYTVHGEKHDKYNYETFPIAVIEPCFEESDTVEITVEGKTKTISRMSAKELNLID